MTGSGFVVAYLEMRICEMDRAKKVRSETGSTLNGIIVGIERSRQNQASTPPFTFDRRKRESVLYTPHSRRLGLNRKPPVSADRSNSAANTGSLSPFRLGSWHVIPSQNRISNESDTLQLSPRNMRVLCYLAQRPGDVIARTELMDQIWSGQIVGEEVLTGAISELRQVLGDDTRRPRYIETIRKGGYRLVMDIEPMGTAEAAPVIEASGRSLLRRFWPLAAVILIAVAWFVGRELRSDSPDRFWQTQPLTSRVGKEVFPALSPDGSRVVYVQRGSENHPEQLYLRQCGTDNEILLAEDEARFLHPTWSPDGATVAFVVARKTTMILKTVPSLGGTVLGLASWEGRSWGLDWSPDGKGIAASVERAEEAARIQVLDLQTRQWQFLTTPVEDQDDRQPAYAPDGRTLAFVRWNAEGDEFVNLLDLQDEDSQPRRLTDQPASYSSLAWLPGGNGLVAAARVTDNLRVWRIDLPDGAMQLEDLGLRHVYHVSTAHSGPGLAVSRLDLDRDLAVVDLRPLGGATTVLRTGKLHSSTWIDGEAVYSPGGGQVAFTSDRSGELQIFLAAAAGGTPRAVTQPQSAMIWNLRWSPDERFLLFGMDDSLVRSYYTLEIQSDARRRLDFADETCRPETWSRDGEWFYADMREQADSRFGRLRIDGRDRQEILPYGADLVYESAAGDTLILHAHHLGRLVRWVDAAPPEVQELPFEFPGRIYYTSSNRYIYALNVDSDANTLYRWDLAASTLEPLGRIDAKVVGPASVAADDSRLVVTIESRRDMDLFLVPDYR
jgi:Tol biopolymer transport system component/DNA-binding winged helix-turn-helix (wHTH) protein